MKLLKPSVSIIGLIVLFITYLYLESRNVIKLEGTGNCTAIDSVLFKKLADLVNKDEFNRDYYEIVYYGHHQGCYSYVLNYNTEYQILRLSNDPCSGFFGRCKIPPQELSKIHTNKVNINEFFQHYESYEKYIDDELPTQGCSFSTIDLLKLLLDYMKLFFQP